MTSFLPALTVNKDGWGPVGEPSDFFPDITFTPFSKSDRLGKAADWTARHFSRNPQAPVSTEFNAFDEEDEEEYSLVDSRVSQKKQFTKKNTYIKTQKNMRTGPPQQQRSRGGLMQNQARSLKGQKTAKTKIQKKNSFRKWGWQTRAQRKYKSSVEVQTSWGEALAVLDFASLNAASLSVPAAEDLLSCGKVEKYNNVYNKVSIRHERALERTWADERKFFSVSTSDDPIISDFAAKSEGNVYATDAIIAVLMTATKSIYSWDLVFTRRGKDTFIDKRDDCWFDYVSVNENSSEPPQEEAEILANTIDALHKEATLINQNFSQQILLKDQDKALSFSAPNPFQTDHVASVAYHYKKWQLPNDVVLVARTEVDAHKSHGGKPVTILVKALNEYDTKITGGWRKKLETQRAGVFATEVKNNNCKLAKWAAQAHLSSAHEIKIGWVSRVLPRDPNSNSVVAISKHTTTDFAHEVGVELNKMWGAVKLILDVVRKFSDGNYILLRDPNKKQLVFYKIAEDEFVKKPDSL